MIFSIMTQYQKTPNLLTLKAATNNFIVVASKTYLVSTSVPVDPKVPTRFKWIVLIWLRRTIQKKR